jgi:hypothetical protein
MQTSVLSKPATIKSPKLQLYSDNDPTYCLGVRWDNKVFRVVHSCNDDYLHRGPIPIIGWYKFNGVAVHSFKSMGFCSCHLQETESVLAAHASSCTASNHPLLNFRGMKQQWTGYLVLLYKKDPQSRPLHCIESYHHYRGTVVPQFKDLLLCRPSGRYVANVIEHVQLQDPSIILHDYWSSCWHGVQLLATTNCLSHSLTRHLYSNWN